MPTTEDPEKQCASDGCKELVLREADICFDCWEEQEDED